MRDIAVISNAAESKLVRAQNGIDTHDRLVWAKKGLERFESHATLLDAKFPDRSLVGLTHSYEHMNELEKASKHSKLHGTFELGPGRDLWIQPGTYNAAMTATGGVIEAVDLIAERKSRFVLVLTRHSGHHCTVYSDEHSEFEEMGMGFCPLSKTVAGARYARRKYGLRVAILDFDRDTGNGTATGVLEQDGIFLVDIYIKDRHAFPYPYTDGSTKSLYVPPRSNIQQVEYLSVPKREVYLERFETEVISFLQAVNPDVIMVSAGYDILSSNDIRPAPLYAGDDRCPSDTYLMLNAVCELGVPVIVSQEGGYDEMAMTKGTEGVMAAYVRHTGRKSW